MKNKHKRVDSKIYIISFIIITLIFFIVGYTAISEIKSFYYSHMKEDALNLANSYSQNVAKAVESTEVVNELLEEKILVASRTTAQYDGPPSSKLLDQLASSLEVDEINIYNSEGEIIYSNMSEFIGWKAYKGQPVYDFMNSNNISYVEEIRPSAVTGIHYKYGYFRNADGSFVQIGVLADKIHDFLGGFEMQQLLDEMQKVGVAAQISFIDNDFIVIGSTDKQLIGQTITNQEVKAAIVTSEEYIFINVKEKESVYEIFVRVYREGNKIGTLAIVETLEKTDTFIKQITIIGLLVLVILYSLLFYIMISTYKKNSKYIQLAYYDMLTGLPNKQYLMEILSEEIEKKDENKKALLLIYCSNFSVVNLTYGYEYGDELLKELSRIIRRLVDSNNRLFRFSLDTFALYTKNYEKSSDLVSIANKINELCCNSINDTEHYLGGQIGIVAINSKYGNVDRLLQDATISLSHIKNNDSSNYIFFNEVMESRLQREILIEKELRAAIAESDSKRLYLVYQPQVDLKTNRVTCFEALARMRTESLGLISPLEFVEVAEKKQLIVPLGNMILKTACQFIRTLKNEGFGDFKVAVNISGIQLLRNDFIETVLDIIKETGIKESSLELEITESVLLDNYEIINEKLKILRDHKIGIALDDFGTGYSSFSRLSELNIDTVKIDRYFISKITMNNQNELIIGDIISMSHKLGLAVVAEGVELQVQKNYLTENDCDIMQGYLFSKPILEVKSIELLKTNIR